MKIRIILVVLLLVNVSQGCEPCGRNSKSLVSAGSVCCLGGLMGGGCVGIGTLGYLGAASWLAAATNPYSLICGGSLAAIGIATAVVGAPVMIVGPLVGGACCFAAGVEACLNRREINYQDSNIHFYSIDDTESV